MKLSTRLSLFFLGTLACLLVGFSVTLYVLASKYLHRQIDERLEAVLNTLAAAAEIDESGIQWEPEERSLSFGRRTVEGQLMWIVRDAEGRRIDGSMPDSERRLPKLSSTAPPGGRARTFIDRDGRPWRLMFRHLEALGSEKVSSKASSERERASEVKCKSLRIEAAVSLAGVRESLGTLGTVLVALSAGTWLLALFIGGRLSHRALRPVTEMALAAHSIGSDDPTQHLPVPGTGDELEELGRAFNGLLDRLRESHERQRRFTGDASHQLRTPLTAIQGQIDLALRQERPPEEYRKVLSLVQRRTQHLRQIVEALLFLARADADSQRPTFEIINLDVWLPEYLRTRSEGAQASTVRLIVEPGAAHCVEAQPSLLGELLNNLLDNASKYGASGTPIGLRLERRDHQVHLSVEDHGAGISPDDLPHIFDPFYRTSSALKNGNAGTGLGLSVASRLAKLFGGHLSAESTPGHGSRFTIHLPASQAERIAS
jgi:signal transduction histidine kinase